MATKHVQVNSVIVFLAPKTLQYPETPKIEKPKQTITTPILLLLTLTALSPLSGNSDAVAELLNLESQSESGVIHLNNNLFRRLLSSSPRAFSLVIFFDAQQLYNKSELHLKELNSEFSLLAKSFISNNKDSPSLSKLFFCYIEFRESQSTFAHFAVNFPPHIRLVPSDAVDVKSDSVAMDASDFSRLAESMPEFIESRTNLSIGPITRPPFHDCWAFAGLRHAYVGFD